LTVMERFIGVIYTLLLMDMSLIPLKKWEISKHTS
jgi:hypothetical protein